MVLLAVAITISVAAAVWIMATYSSMWRPEVLRVVEVSVYFDAVSDSWWLRVVAINEGEREAEIYKVELEGVETIDMSPPKVVKPGERVEVSTKLSEEYVHGATYTIKLYLKSGTVYSVVGKAQ